MVTKRRITSPCCRVSRIVEVERRRDDLVAEGKDAEDALDRTGAAKRVFGDDLGGASMSSTKSAIGHLLGGAGAVESIFCILAMRDQIAPPTLNLDNPSEGCEGVDLVPHKAKKRQIRAVLNNSFGFGGTNASLVMKQVA